MKKILKISGIVLLVPIALLLLAAIVIPIFFKDDVKRALDKTIENYVDAKISYNSDKISLSVFKDFPNVRFGIGDLSIINKAPFGGDTLLSVSDFGVSLDIKSMLTNNFQINGIDLVNPRVKIKVLENGKASWDIVKSDSTAPSDTSTSALAIKIDHWQITNGFVDYDDKSLGLLAVVQDLTHEGSGTIEDIIQLVTTTAAQKVYVSYGGVTYLNQVALDAKTNLDIAGNKYTLKENSLKLNDLTLAFEGWTEVADAISMDMSLKTNQNSFKNLVSLIPSVFMEGYENVEANGTFDLSGRVNGTYTDSIYPAFDIKLMVKDADFKHPTLPKKIEQIALNMQVSNTSSNLDQTTIDLKTIGLKMGNNFVNGRLLVKGLNKYFVDTDLKAKINLAEVEEFYPLQGTSLKGLLDFNVVGKGVVDLAKNSFPTLNGYANLSNGFVKSPDFNLPVENINFKSTYVSDGSAKGSSVKLTDISLLLDGDKFGGAVSVSDFDALNFDANLNGKIDLGKLMKVFPIEGTELAGIVNITDFKTKGNMKAIDEERYQDLNTSGKAHIQNLSYKEKEYVPYGLSITDAKIWFTPEKIMIDSYKGFLGKSDMDVKGYLSNYMAFALSDNNAVLGGKMDFTSKNFDSNIFFYETEGATTDQTEVSQVYVIPNNIDFTLNGGIGTLLYDDLTLTNFVGEIMIRNGVAFMRDTKFKTLGANFITTGSYDTRDALKPMYDFKLTIDKMSIKEAYAYFNVIKALAPIGNKIDGFFSTEMTLNGVLQQDYMPDLKTLNMRGDLNILEAILKVTDIKTLSALGEKTKALGINNYSIKNALANVIVKDGRLWVSPFTLQAQGVSLTTQLNKSLVDNGISHSMLVDAPSASLKNSISSFGLDANTIGDRIKLNFDVLGTFLNPKIVLKNANSKGVKGVIKGAVEDRIDKGKADAEARAKAELDKAKAEAEQRLKDAETKARAEAERVKAEAEAKAKAEAEKAKAEAKAKLEAELKNKGVKLPTPGGLKIPSGTK
jgi:hypothetical protein